MIAVALILCHLSSYAFSTSVAGLYPLANSGRAVYNFNDGWRFMLGDPAGAEATRFDDSQWEMVSAPHSVRLEPADVSGCRNYQGPCWYRKTFVLPEDMRGKEVTVHFEAVMGKQWIYVNGKLVRQHLGGYLPITVNLSQEGVEAGDTCLIAMKADNSDDKTYPPGKKQTQLDFAYHGGMYRDVWLIGKSSVHITDPIERGQVAGGGVFLHYANISEKKADIYIDVEVENTLSGSSKDKGNITVVARIKDADGKLLKTVRQTHAPAKFSIFNFQFSIPSPHLWSPEDPYLYQVEIQVLRGREVMDGGMVRAGIRKAEFRGREGFWLNGRPYHQLIGGNRHQDFAYVGNAMPNSQHWRDAKRLKEAGMTIIRAAHYPQDPAFMDACDELGLFIIVPTPGWQYWNKDPEWGEMVHQNTRDIIRRDRNHACLLMWEPILNETRYPADFALKALQITRDEYPYEGRPVAAADLNSEGVKENYDVLYDWADNVGKGKYEVDKCIFTREWGEYVDDWYAHNAINRAARGWGEQAQLTAALSLADTYAMMYRGRPQFIGGCQWHPFDHQRGYHPDAYLGGIYDAFRQKKYAFEMFRSQRHDEPMVFIAHEMTQFSDSNVIVFSNCDSVRLTALDGWKTATQSPCTSSVGASAMPSQTSSVFKFPGFWNFWKAREQSYTNRQWQNVRLVAEGIKDGKVVCRQEKMPSRRSTRLRLHADEMGRPLVADGSDFIVIIAEVTDDNGNVRRLAREQVTFTVEGEGTIIGDATIGANPRIVEWGSAPCLVRSTHQAGKIRIIARPAYEGTHAPEADTLEIESIPYDIPVCHLPSESLRYHSPSESLRYHRGHPQSSILNPQRSISNVQPSRREAGEKATPEQLRKELEEVEKQQQDFGIDN